MSSVVADFLFAHGDDGFFTRGNVVSVETSSLHELHGRFLSFDGDWVRSLDITSDIGTVGEAALLCGRWCVGDRYVWGSTEG